jgi:hypothetical protein
MLEIGPIGILMRAKVSGILLSPDMLKRYSDTINPGEKEDEMRKMILSGL